MLLIDNDIESIWQPGLKYTSRRMAHKHWMDLCSLGPIIAALYDVVLHVYYERRGHKIYNGASCTWWILWC